MLSNGVLIHHEVTADSTEVDATYTLTRMDMITAVGRERYFNR